MRWGMSRRRRLVGRLRGSLGRGRGSGGDGPGRTLAMFRHQARNTSFKRMTNCSQFLRVRHIENKPPEIMRDYLGETGSFSENESDKDQNEVYSSFGENDSR